MVKKGETITSSTKTASIKSDSSTSSKSSSASNTKETGLPAKYPDWRFERKGKETKLIRNNKTYWWCDVLNM
jgi:hypothetical protein